MMGDPPAHTAVPAGPAAAAGAGKPPAGRRDRPALRHGLGRLRRLVPGPRLRRLAGRAGHGRGVPRRHARKR